MPVLGNPETAFLDFQRETEPLVFLARLIEDGLDASDRERVLCEAVQQAHEKAEVDLKEAVR